MAEVMTRNRRRRDYMSLWLWCFVHEVSMLTSHWIVDRVKSRLVGYRLNHWLKPILKLLVIKPVVRHHWGLHVLLLLAHTIIHAQPLELLSCGSDVDELLLKAHLLLCKILVGGNKLRI